MVDTPSTKILDHIVHLTPPGSVQETSDQFRKLGFNVIPGGTHTDGLTANALVILADGVYLELISFTHPASYYPPGSSERVKRDTHSWASKSPGWIDFAFLGNGSLTPPRISDIINERARKDGSGAVYALEVVAGRERPDGRVLKWVISAPKEDVRGTLPFFCGDVTPRDWRVPSDPPSNVEHPSTTQGISHVRILTGSDDLATVSRQLTSVIGNPPASSTETEITWHLDTPQTGNGGPRLILSLPRDVAETDFIREGGVGVFEVAFRVQDKKKEGTTQTPYGKVVWVSDP
ncbi:hypothetical protein Hypma_013666 [Hypsizygus marmoreus]|uniref:Glyoxalase-like domain-containing protein n=1 Tax=Hypsizygus marmoreus TaxID=39966 RepID=A0A369JBM2_HYPMA|nr:hypothetical protein Hypma_013666 [Hypsizygus marmoreus]